MTSEDFTRMTLWVRSLELAAEVARLVAKLPRERTADVIGTQLMRSIGSVPANIAEGYGRYSQAAYRSHLSIARGSLFESQSWIDLLERTGFLSEETKKGLITSCQEVGRMLTFRMKSLGRADLTYARKEPTQHVKLP
jgi:four helix bundle protein